ncbi:DUF3006 domain-containing protein [Halococcus salsus]|uniref:DUF3006 domain-containing protein n=1 Tax=Halococcus salsus TaxID=2162894 RepID=UPI001359EAAC|nr:DUF3006 domain-containing protein [Halococcus salsus]
MKTEEYRGVLDRFEGDQAVVLLERNGSTIDDIVISRKQLPEDGNHVDAIFVVEIEGDRLKHITYLPDETATRSKQAQDRFRDLSERPPDENEG